MSRTGPSAKFSRTCQKGLIIGVMLTRFAHVEFFVFFPLGDIFSTVGLRAPPAMALPRLLAASWPRLRCVALLELVARAAAEVGVVLFIASPQLHTSFREVFVRVKLPIIKNGAKYLVEIHVRLLLPRIVNNAFNIRTQ